MMIRIIRRFLSSLLEVIEVAAIAIVAVFLIRGFLVQPFLVSGASMSPNFEDGDYLLIDELTYRVRPPARGEVVVFRYPNDESTFFIKRIIGLPGERVVVRNGSVTVFDGARSGGVLLEEHYLPEGVSTNGVYDMALGEREYFLLGDNRSYSFDSRSWGALSGDEIVGLVRLRLWPPMEAKVFAVPEY